MNRISIRSVGLVLFALSSVAEIEIPPVPYNEVNYVLLNLDVSSPAVLESDTFCRGTYWSDAAVPQAGKKYYVPAMKVFTTPWKQNAVDQDIKDFPATYNIFQGDMLVVAGDIRHLVGTNIHYTIPNLHLLNGARLVYTSPKTAFKGTATIHSDEADPAMLQLSYDSLDTQEFAMDLKGTTNSCLSFQFATNYYGYTSSKTANVKLTGDQSGFEGMLKVYPHVNSGAGPFNDFLTLGGTGFPGTVKLEPRARLAFDGQPAVTLANLVLADGSSISFGYSPSTTNAATKLTVTNAVQVTGTAFVELSGSFAGAAQDVELIRFAPQADVTGLSAEQFRIRNAAFPASCLTLALRADADGGHTLCVSAVVVVTLKNASDATRALNPFENATNSTGNAYWSDGECPGVSGTARPDVIYVAQKLMHAPYTTSRDIYELKCRGMMMSGGMTFDTFWRGIGFSCANLNIENVSIQMGSNNTTLPSEFLNENGLPYAAYRILGGLHVRGSNILLTYGTRNLYRVESEMDGDGDFTLKTVNYASDINNNRGYHEFTGINTNYTGKISVTVASNTTQYGVPFPSTNHYVRLLVSDGRNLGGARAVFAYDALHLEQYSQLFLRDNVTLADGVNRGVSIGNVGRFHVTNNLTLAVSRPLTLNGRLVKEGSGTLALGGTLKFGGSAQSDTPTAFSNVLEIAGGKLKPLTTNACDGLAISFAEGTSLVIDGATTDTGLLKCGLYDVKEANAPITLASGLATLPVEVEYGDWTPTTTLWTVGLVTVKSERAAALQGKLRLANPKPFRMRRGEIVVVDNGDGTSTLAAVYKLYGLMIMVR